MKPDFNDILNECLEAMVDDGKAAEECLLSFEEGRAELEPLLATAVKLIDAGRITPDGTRKQLARERLLAEVEQRRWEVGIDRAPAGESISVAAPRWRRTLVRLGVITVAFVMLSGGTLVIADESLPGNPLYPLKLTAEKARIGLARSDDGRAILYLGAAKKRIHELKKLKDSDKNYAGLINAVAENIEAAGSTIGYDNKILKSTLTDIAQKNEDVLRDVLDKVPERAKPAIERALNNISNNNEGKSNLGGRKASGMKGEENSDRNRRLDRRKMENRSKKQVSRGARRSGTRRPTNTGGHATSGNASTRGGKAGGTKDRNPAAVPGTSAIDPGSSGRNPSATGQTGGTGGDN
ncbi:MAG TPA: DUF5667 domain-containing protein [Anaerolineae bacterium]|nr:DUF5667 domain-containing protein [Anaerolineae bacterium]